MLTSRETYDPHPEDAWKRLKMRCGSPANSPWCRRSPPGASARRATATCRAAASSRTSASTEIAQQQPRDASGAGQAAHDPEGLGALGDRRPRCWPPSTPRWPCRRRRCRSCRASRSPEGSNAAAELAEGAAAAGRRKGRASRPRCWPPATTSTGIAADGEEAEVAALHGWRREVFGEQALKLVRGEIALKFEKRRLVVFETQR